MVHRHMVACAQEAARDFQDCADTPAGAGLVAIYEIMRQAAWSMGSSLSSNGLTIDPLKSDALAEIAREFDDGFSHPGEGVML